MRRTTLLTSVLILMSILLAPLAAQGREATLTTGALRVEEREGVQVLVLPAFTIESGTYTVVGESGEFVPDTETMDALGTPENPATLTKSADESGEGAFVVTATNELDVHFGDERLFANGTVTYTGDDAEAVCDTLVVDSHTAVREALEDLIQEIEDSESRDIILRFFEQLPEDARLVFLNGNVRVQREDSTITAAWMVFDESNQDSFISGAYDDQPLQLQVTIEEVENDAISD